MRSKISFFGSLIVFIGLMSCTSSKDLIYLKDMPNKLEVEKLAEENSQHLIIPGDILYISIKSINSEVNAVFNPNERSGQQNSNVQQYTSPGGAYLYGFEVNTEGNIVLPILGNIQVVDLPQAKIEELVQQKADEYIKDAIVKVKLLSFRITMLGEVTGPGVYYNYNNSLTVLEAIAMAGGQTDFANIKDVMVVRRGVEGNTSYMLDLSTKEAFLSEAFYLKPNDYVLVRPNNRKVLQLNSQTFSMIWSSVSIIIGIIALTR